MNPTVFFDIETAPLPEEEVVKFMPEFSAPSNYKDQAKIDEYIKGRKAEWLDRAALSPLTGKVCAIGVEQNGEVTLHLDDDEQMLLTKFWRQWASDRGLYTNYVGFNITQFDIPFLIRRSWKLGIPIPFELHGNRFWELGFVDVMNLWQCGDRKETISLDSLCKFLGVGAKNGSGEFFHKLLKEDPEKAKEYLTNDLRLIRRCYERTALAA
jgi:hypothetical protein